MKIAKIIVIAFAAIIAVLLGVLIFVPSAKSPAIRVMPPSIQSADGSLRIFSPIPNATISPPVVVHGDVTGGGWFFEASFPIKVLDSDGTVLGQGTAQAESDWTSTGTVPFSASIVFTAPRDTTGTILFANDNPSGLPQNQKTLSLQIQFASSSAAGNGGDSTGATANNGIVKGQVILGPTCPVEHIPPDPQCAPKLYQTTIAISRNIETPSAFETISSNASGTFSVSLAPGEYDFYVQNAGVYPRCTEQVITVSAGQTSNITINCDTGIR